MASKGNVIFLDIDGPMIPLSLTYYTIDNPGDRIMSNVCVGILNNICKRTEAKIVTNTTHNIDHPGQETIKQVLIRNGVKEEFFHESSKTIYGSKIMDRKKAIRQWLTDNGDHKWISIDDEAFINTPNLILIDRDWGITLNDMWKALEYFGVKRHFLEI